jgi:4-amino-4-deoxy-L-arabinose transferase-like glycosyltransferase
MNVALSTQDERRTPITFTRILRIGPLVLALGIFLAIALHQLHLPGFYYDEALDLVPILHVMRGEQPELLRNIGIGNYPVMLLDYMGSLGGYLTVPFMWVFGQGWVAARAQPIFFSCVTIVLAWLLARRWFGDCVAAVTVLLLAVNPSFIWFSRQGVSVTSVMTVFSLGSLLLFDDVIRWASAPEVRRKSLLFALIAGILVGLGLWAKFLFFRWVVVLIVMGLVFLFTRSSEARHTQSQKQHLVALMPALLIGLVGACVGAAPLIYYNLVGLVRDGQPWTVALLFNALLHPTQQFGVNNANFLANQQKSIDDVRVFIDGSYFWYNGIPFSNVYAVPTFLIAVGVGLVFAVARLRSAEPPHPHPNPNPNPFPLGKRESGRRFFALVVAVLTLIFLGAFTVTGLWSTHQFIMLPLPQMIVSCAVVWTVAWGVSSVERFSRRRFPSTLHASLYAILICAFLALPFSRDIWVNQQHHNTLATTGGSGRFSDAVYKLGDWLDQNKISQPIALDWGIERQIRVLTGDRVRPLEIFGYTPDPNVADDAFRQRATEMLADPNRSYIVLWDRFAVYNRRQAFTEVANSMGKEVVETFIAHEKSGLPVYVVLQAR